MDTELLQSYRQAARIARARARNFYYSFVLLPAEKRLALCAVYAFMRHCDDLSDGDYPEEQKREMLRCWRRQLDGALGGGGGGDPIFPALVDSVRRFSIPAEYFHWMLDGVEMDLGVCRYDTFEQLYRYCFCVAGSVGLTCLQIFGFSEERAKALAEHCGIAFQLTNILRDVKEDAGMGRIYLPQEDLRKFGYGADDLARGIVDGRFRDLMTFQAGRAREYYQRGRQLIPLVERASRPALWAMIEIYGRLLERIVRVNYDVFRRAIRLPVPEKYSIALRALSMRLIPALAAWR